MEKVDIAIAVVGAVALLATGLGVAFYDDFNNLTEYTVESETLALTGSANGASGSIELDIPDNMYHAMMDFTISFSSPNPAAACTVSVDISVTGPDGVTVVYDGEAGIGAGSLTVAIAAEKWGSAPSDFTGTADDKAAKTTMYSEPLTIAYAAQDTGCGAPILGVGGVAYGAVNVSGDWHGYSIVGDEPEIEAA